MASSLVGVEDLDAAPDQQILHAVEDHEEELDFDFVWEVGDAFLQRNVLTEITDDFSSIQDEELSDRAAEELHRAPVSSFDANKEQDTAPDQKTLHTTEEEERKEALPSHPSFEVRDPSSLQE